MEKRDKPSKFLNSNYNFNIASIDKNKVSFPKNTPYIKKELNPNGLDLKKLFNPNIKTNILDAETEKILFGTDFHGNWEDYIKTKEKFKQLKKEDKADILVFGGDLIHKYPNQGYKDESKRILDDLIDNDENDIIALMGNHELGHVYQFEFSTTVDGKRHDFVGPFEEKIEDNRKKYADFFLNMPYTIRTKSGVVLNHAGLHPALGGWKKGYGDLVEKVDNLIYANMFDHGELLEYLKDLAGKYIVARFMKENGKPLKLDKEYFDDYTPEIGEVFNNFAEKNYLWDMYFNMNEFQYGDEYDIMLCLFLDKMGRGFAKQNFVLSGHVHEPKGYNIVNSRQLRVTSSMHVEDDSKKRLALVDAGGKYSSINELVDNLQNLYE